MLRPPEPGSIQGDSQHHARSQHRMRCQTVWYGPPPADAAIRERPGPGWSTWPGGGQEHPCRDKHMNPSLSDVSTVRLSLLRAMYLFMFVGLALTRWPGILNPPPGISNAGTVTFGV